MTNVPAFMKWLPVSLRRSIYSLPFSPPVIPPFPLSIMTPSSFHHPLLFSSGIYRVAPDASTSLLCWSLAHAGFRLGSLCSSFAFSLRLLPPPPPPSPPCRQPFVRPSLSKMGRLLGLCILTSHLFFLFSCFLFFTPVCLLPANVCSLSFTSSDHSASTPDFSFLCLLTACVNMSVVFLVSRTVSCVAIERWDKSSMLFLFVQEKLQTSEKCQFVVLKPFVSIDCLLNPTPEQSNHCPIIA